MLRQQRYTTTIQKNEENGASMCEISSFSNHFPALLTVKVQDHLKLSRNDYSYHIGYSLASPFCITINQGFLEKQLYPVVWQEMNKTAQEHLVLVEKKAISDYWRCVQKPQESTWKDCHWQKRWCKVNITKNNDCNEIKPVKYV